jgi:hypothetical protein
MTRASTFLAAKSGLAAALVFLCLGGMASCGDPTGNGAPLPGSSAGSGSGAKVGTGGQGSGGAIIQPGTGGTLIAPGDAGTGTCIRAGMLGRLPTYGAVPGSDNTAALQRWLNERSTAVVDVYTTDTPITAEFLNQYQILILQPLEDREGGALWNLTPDEIAAFEAWVRAGGGVIALTGYGASSQEVTPTNALLAFAGMSYATDDILGTCPDNDCCCASNSVPLGGWNATHPIAANMTRVGAFHGRSVTAPGADVVASQGTTTYGATKQIDMGRVFVFCDEWVSYTSQWDGTGADTCATDPAHNLCAGRLAQEYYQVPQFWYNALKWASGDEGCFDLVDDSIVK